MKAIIFLPRIIDPTLKLIADMPSIAIPVTDKARLLLLAIAGQESDWTARRQHGGPARSYWQFEGAGGGVGEVFAKTPRQLSAICAGLEIPFDIPTVFEAMAWNDTLACTMARLLLWQDPAPLPEVGDIDTAWNYYIRGWRPGLPSRTRWNSVYPSSLNALQRP